MKKKIVAAVTALVLGGVVFSGCGMHGHHGMMKGDFNPRNMHRVISKLDLTDAQESAFKELRESAFEHRPDMKELSKYITPTTFDSEGLKTFMASKSENNISSRVGFMQKAYNILTPKQREIFLNELKKDK